MKYLFTVITISLILFSCVSKTSAVTKTAEKIDKEYSKVLVGTWVKNDSGPIVVAKYFENGTMQMFWYSDKTLKYVLTHFEGNWWIKDKRLFHEIKKLNYVAEGFERLPIGSVASLRLIELSKDKLIFENERGLKTTMSRH